MYSLKNGLKYGKSWPQGKDDENYSCALMFLVYMYVQWVWPYTNLNNIVIT